MRTLSQSQSITPVLVNSGGGEIQTSWGSLDFSIGEVAIATIGNTTAIITQGFLQPYFFYVSTEEIGSIDKRLKVYPNPTANYLTIELENGIIEDIAIHDILGRKIENYSINNNVIDFSELNQGCYILSIVVNQKNYSYTIIKI